MTPMPSFDPPYESPVEEALAWSLVKLLHGQVSFLKQHEVSTRRGNFRLDFLLVTPAGLRIGIEVDGKQFHSYRRDAWRDAVILGEGHVDVMIRFAARDVHYRVFDTIAVLRHLYPEAFDPYQVIAVDRLASSEVESAVRDWPQFVWVQYEEEVLDDGSSILMLVSHEGHAPATSQSWRQLFEFATSKPKTPLYSLEDAYQLRAV